MEVAKRDTLEIKSDLYKAAEFNYISEILFESDIKINTFT